ncbi:MAG TPA: hypothetical protein VM243_21290 [Phycisphaerae bacterium]|nr:hypothetical protein [Phycisphaerae bacterium]
MPRTCRLLCAVTLVLAGGCVNLDPSRTPGLEALADLFATPQSTDLPASRDRDGDGLTNEEEDQLGTEHGNPDTDADGLDDLLELETGTDPTVPNQDQTVDGVPPAFDGLILPGESRVFFRGAEAPFVAYLRLMGLVRSDTRVSIEWQEITEDEPLTRATTDVTFRPRQHWYWGHDLGGSATVSDPADMTVTQLTVTVQPGGDSLAYNFISSGGLRNGPRGLVPFPQDLADADLNITLLMAHGLADEAATWDSFAFMAERISENIRIIRTDVEPAGAVAERAGELARFIQREEPGEFYAIGHSMGGLDLRYILTKAAQADEAFVNAADAILGLYTIATPHDGAFLAGLTEEFPEFTEFIDLAAPAVIDLEPGSDVLDYLNESFDGDVTIDGRIVPVTALAFQAGAPLFPASDGVVEIASQAFGDHVISDVPSTRGAGLGAGKHVPFVPSRADVELHSFEVLGRILSDIVARRTAPEF